MTTKNHNAPLRRRPYDLKVEEVATVTTTDRQTLVTPRKGFRMRLSKLRVIQDSADGRHLCEIYFGTAPNIITDLPQGVDILAVPDLGSDQTRTFLKNEGPVGLRNDPISLRWRGTAPANAHRAIVEYTEEP